MAIQSGRSYFSASRGDLSPADPTKWVLPLSLLPTRYAPIEGQVRVAVGDTEYTYDDPAALSRPTTNKWTYEQRAFVANAVQVRRVFVHAITKLATAGTFDSPSLKEVVYYDENGDRIPVAPDEVYGSSTDEGGPFASTAPADEPEPAIGSPGGGWNFQLLYDLDDTTDGGFSSSGTSRHHYVLFNVPKLISKIGFNGQDGGGSRGGASAVEIWLDIGTASDPEWVQVVDETGLTQSDYPNTSTPIDPDTMMREVELPAAILGAVPFPTIIIDPAPDDLSTRVTLIRETRQDRPWVRPYNGARAHGESLHWYWTQLLYIYQEMCELPALAALTGLPVAELIFNPYTNASVLDVGGTTRNTISYEGLELLEGIPGAPTVDVGDQIVVERGDQSDGSSTSWSEISVTSIDTAAKTLNITSTSLDVRIRRVTRISSLWADIRTTGPIGWNSAIVALLQKQIRFLREEACFLPSFYEGHILNNSIFPRAWNFLTFIGAGAQFQFGGPSWGGDGAVTVFQNDVQLTEGDDYEVVWPGIVLNVPQGPTDQIVIGGGGGGGGFTAPDGDDDSNDDDGTSLPIPPSPSEEIEWPGLDLPPSLGFTISVGGSTEDGIVSDYEADGASFPNGVFNNESAVPERWREIRPKITVTRTTGGDSALDSYDEGESETVWIDRYCIPPFGWAVAAIADTNGDGTINQATARTSACLSQSADQNTSGLVRAALGTVNMGSANPLPLNFALGLLNRGGPLVNGNIDNIPGIQAWDELAQQSIAAEAAGVVGSAGFSGEQFEQYLDPDADFDDFDIPLP